MFLLHQLIFLIFYKIPVIEHRGHWYSLRQALVVSNYHRHAGFNVC